MRQFLNQLLYIFGNQNMEDAQGSAQQHEESNASLTRQELSSLIANRQEWDRLVKLVRVYLKYMKNHRKK